MHECPLFVFPFFSSNIFCFSPRNDAYTPPPFFLGIFRVRLASGHLPPRELLVPAGGSALAAVAPLQTRHKGHREVTRFGIKNKNKALGHRGEAAGGARCFLFFFFFCKGNMRPKCDLTKILSASLLPRYPWATMVCWYLQGNDHSRVL